MAWTDRQEKAITKRHKSLLVSAAAGSGKTAVLVERVIRLIRDEDVSLENMLIVTFTNAAAAEMKERIYDALNKQLSGGGLTADRQRHIRAQMTLLGRANISTFHKFALEVVHRYYHVIGVKPNLAICDETRTSILSREALDELMESRYEADDPAFRSFLDCYATSRGDDAVRNMILEFHKFLQSLPDPQKWTDSLLADPGQFDAAYRDFAVQQAQRRVHLAQAYFKRAADELAFLPKLYAKNEEDLAFAASLDALLASGDLTGALNALEGHRYKTMSVTKDEKEDWEAIRESVTALREKAKDHIKKAKKYYLPFSEEKAEKEREMMLPQLGTLISLTGEFSSRYGAKKDLLGLLDFSDIEHFALRILENEEVSAEYREKFSHIFIDEYQDSNMVQETLISRIARPDNVFRVGDVKQSIYKFRLAEPELFLEKYDSFKSGEVPDSEVIDLNSNFRSKREVIDLVNLLFHSLMIRETTGMDYTDDEALVKGSSYEGPLSYAPKLYLIDTAVPGEEEADEPDDEEEDEEYEEDGDAQDDAGKGIDQEILELKAAELEALNAVRVIREYHGKTIRDEKKETDRPLRYGDMVILLRAVRGVGEVFYQTLTEAGLPVFLERTEGYFDVVEIQVFLNLLRLIDNRSQDIPLLSVLRSPVFGFSSSDLAAIRIWAKARGDVRTPYNRVFAMYREEGPDGPLKEKCRAFSAKRENWRRLSRHMPLGDFLWQLLTDSGYAAFASAVPAGTQRLANLRALADKAEAYEAENAGGLYGFINYIDAINSRGGKVDVGQVKILSENADVVRIMTVHKSKGLEFPFVLLAGLGRKAGRNDTSKAAFHKSFGAALRLVDPKTGLYADPLSLRIIRRKKSTEELAEEIRVLYVALTRPKDIVLMSAAVKNAQDVLEKARNLIPGDVDSNTKLVSAILPLLPESSVELISRVTAGEQQIALRQKRIDLTENLEHGFHPSADDLPVTKEEIARRLDFCYDPPQTQMEKRKYSVSQIAAMEREKLQALPKQLTPAEGADPAEPQDMRESREALPVFLSGEKKMDAASRGTAYHTVMEHLPFTPEGKDPDSIRSFMDSLVSRGLLTQAEYAAVDPRRIAAFFRSQIGKEAMAAQELYKEAPFTIRHDMNGRPVLVQGTIDCCFRQGDGWVLADYKSNYIDKKDLDAEMKRLRAEYLPQLALYREALEGVTGMPVKKAVLYLFGIDQEISIDD
ncbi:MAG: helicase-exonuclease AddAB subunit AddA [Firmicutes bacterium]|nr:helicase-exonuclease AddAB subunit AddA [Bacillota bacterium]